MYMQGMETVKQLGLWSSLGTHGSLVVLWLLWISNSGETWKFDFLNQIWPWRSRSIALKTLGMLTKVCCTSGPILVILAWMGDELWCGQAQNGVNLDFQVKFDIEGQWRSLYKTKGTLTKVLCIFGPNLMILAWTGPELSRGQANDWHTDRQTHTHRRRKPQYLKAKTGLRVKMAY